MKLIYLLIALIFVVNAPNASATNISVVYINDSITADIYFNNGSNQYYQEETNLLSDNYNTVMIVGTIDTADDLLNDPTIIYDKILYLLGILFFAFMFVLVIWIIKKVIG